jgi:hypothetical protein
VETCRVSHTRNSEYSLRLTRCRFNWYGAAGASIEAFPKQASQAPFLCLVAFEQNLSSLHLLSSLD